MSTPDYLIFAAYMAAIMGVGFWFHLRNQDAEDYYVGGRSISPGHVGLSVAATDVGGGFSIGLGGLGYAMGLSGSWLLFTGLVGAWLAAVFVIPRLKRVDAAEGMMTYPDFLRFRFDDRVALVAAVISALGYLGFTSGQILAGAKLMSGSLLQTAPFGMDVLTFSTLIIGVVVVAYTVLGGLKAVIYTDTVQWIILMAGLILLAIPFTLREVGGIAGMVEALPPGHLSLTNVDLVTVANWFITIAPIWVVGMTLYQRMYACRTTRDAQRAWYIAGLFEYPVMAFAGVTLGMLSRILFPGIDGELGVPMLLAQVLPVGLAGVVVASYFSAIMSTADSCVIASSGNVVGDILQRSPLRIRDPRRLIRASQLTTLVVGATAVVLAWRFTTVLDAILQAYAFLVSGLFVPTLGAYFWPRGTSRGAFWGMITGGGTTLVLLLTGAPSPLGLDPSFWGILVSGMAFVTVSLLDSDGGPDGREPEHAGPVVSAAVGDTSPPRDRVTVMGSSTLQHGPFSDRIYLMELAPDDLPELPSRLLALGWEKGYGKIMAKCPEAHAGAFREAGFIVEARVPHFFGPDSPGLFLSRFLHRDRSHEPRAERVKTVLEAAQARGRDAPEVVPPLPAGMELREATPDDAPALAALYGRVFRHYPFPIHDPEHLRDEMAHGTRFFSIRENGRLAAASSMEPGGAPGVVEMTDFATLPDHRGQGLATHLLATMDRAAEASNHRVTYTIARALSHGMNITFARRGYRFAGTLLNNTRIADGMESMNVWHRTLINLI